MQQATAIPGQPERMLRRVPVYKEGQESSNSGARFNILGGEIMSEKLQERVRELEAEQARTELRIINICNGANDWWVHRLDACRSECDKLKEENEKLRGENKSLKTGGTK